MRRHISYGEERIGFSIRFVPRPARRISIHVSSDGVVAVDAPEGTAVEEVVAAVRRRVRWVWLHVRAGRERSRHVLPRKYVSGESHFYLGRRHVLKVSAAPKGEPGVKLLRGKLEITVHKRDPAQIRNLLDAWYRHRATDVFARRIAACAERAAWVKTTPGFRLLTMRTQWGSCSPQGGLLLNPLLVKAPGPCVDYVICHELCHLKEHNHSERFYALLHRLMPDWQKWKTELDERAEHLLNR
ncbi:MAG: M48 family metallopeptidase [Sterolibacteriaceae bacterium MAG5]|nr:M48 family metallopeptidase [Candidatus Nitricoxidireducens bremensis]